MRIGALRCGASTPWREERGSEGKSFFSEIPEWFQERWDEIPELLEKRADRNPYIIDGLVAADPRTASRCAMNAS
ncbi:MAG: hypothetical protein AAF982_13275, partial [Pseudomonadota bacterium]